MYINNKFYYEYKIFILIFKKRCTFIIIINDYHYNYRKNYVINI